MLDMSTDCLKSYGSCLQTPFSLIVSGQSQSGKTTFVKKLLLNWENVCGDKPSRILWLYGINQPELFTYLKNANKIPVTFVEGFDVQKLKDTLPFNENVTVILDDLNRESFSEPYFASLFDRVCHHNNCNVIAISQNLFDSGKYFRHAMLNATYLAVLSSARDKRSLSYLNSQIFPGQAGFLTDAYHKAVELNPYGHLLIDTSAHQHPELRVRSGIFDTEQIYYLPASSASQNQIDINRAFTNA